MDDTGALTTAHRPDTARALLEGVVATLSLGDHQLHLACDDGLRLAAHQAAAVETIVREALANAVAHAFPGDRRGTVWLSLHRVEGRLRLRIKDDGIGIADTDLEVMPGLARIARAAEAMGGYARMGSASRSGGEVVAVFPDAA